MIDKDRLFHLFGDSENDNPEVKKLVNADTDFMQSPEAKLGMFTKMIYNHEVFHKKLKKFFQKENASYNVQETKEASSFAVFNRAYSYIKKINVNNVQHQDALWEFNSKPLFSALNQFIILKQKKNMKNVQN